jgi:hypothetical protein
LPEHVKVSVEGSPILGGISQGKNKNLPPDAPQVLIKATVILGGVDVSIRHK